MVVTNKATATTAIPAPIVASMFVRLFCPNYHAVVTHHHNHQQQQQQEQPRTTAEAETTRNHKIGPN
jgi:hypothetical protein